MAAIAQLASGIAHDFNNLLTVVMGNLDMLKRAKEERRPRLIDNALHAVEQARKLTGRLLAFSRRQTLVPEPVDLKGMIAGMDDMLAQSLRGDIRLELDLAERVWPVEVDPTQLQIALINIAVNARDAMPKGGTFRVKTENTVLRNGADAGSRRDQPDRHRASASRRRLCPRCSSRSSRRRRSGKAPGSGWRRSMALPSSQAGRWTSAARSAGARR